MAKYIVVLLLLSELFFALIAGAVEKVAIKKNEFQNNPFVPTVNVLDTKVVLDLKISELLDSGGKKKSPKALQDPSNIQSSHFELTTSINKTNHFYLAHWHVEIPAFVFDKNTRNWRADLKVYQLIGKEQEADEYIGTVSLVGPLIPRDKFFSLEAKKRKTFKNLQGLAAYAIEVSGLAQVKSGPVAKRDP